jgi:hypothetical protein
MLVHHSLFLSLLVTSAVAVHQPSLLSEELGSSQVALAHHDRTLFGWGKIKNKVVDPAKDAIDCVKNPLSCAKDTVVDPAKDAIDCVKNPLSCAKDTVVDPAKDAIDCVKNPLSCAKDNLPFLKLVPDCLLDGKPESCFLPRLIEAAQELGTYTARLQQVAATSFYEVGYTLLRIAKEARDRRLEDCKGEDSINIPVRFSFQKKKPFVHVDNVKLPTCHLASKYLKDMYGAFKDCFLHDLTQLGPKIVAIWKDQQPGTEAMCNAKDNFAIILKLKLSANTKVKFLSGGGGIGLAFGCKDGKMKQKMVFDYEAGFHFVADPMPLTISMHQTVGFLHQWPTHYSDFFQDVGNLRLTFGLPKAANMVVQAILNQVCQRALPDAVSAVLCTRNIPQNVQLLFDPPQFDFLKVGKPTFTGFKSAGLQLGWAFNMYSLTPAGSHAAVAAKV